LYVGNLPYTTGEAELQELFSRAGTVESVRVMRDAATGRARGFAFVEMATEADAQAAISKLNDQSFEGRRITVQVASSPGPGRSGGGGGGRPGGGGGRGGGGGGYGVGGGQRRPPRW
jgi:RNA recognition motif-containing protein